MAVYGFAIIVGLMVYQTKPSQCLMVNVVEGEDGDLRVTSLVFYVAALALSGAGQDAMQPDGFDALFGYFYVAALAAIFGDTVNWRMAMLALLLKLGVCGIAS